ncbi:MAG TPA: imidazole glycerol phosphate synthase subunit HisH [Dehalococcoidia bacterium]|nr:imidazole glycerol phosphate synthase subunit HisH [Dehalococcoidia bacterium]
MVSIVDYGAGNLRSVINAVAKLGYQPKLVVKPQEVLEAGVLILPGVGAAAHTIESLKRLGLDDAIKRYIADGRPFLGVCIGLQVLFTSTEEGGGYDCLGIIPGRVKRIPADLKIPHMGWNQVKQKVEHMLFSGVPDGADFYFVHSYYVEPDDKTLIAGETEYGVNMCSVLIRDNLVATQFHPEKSGQDGLKIYDNFISMVQ